MLLILTGIVAFTYRPWAGTDRVGSDGVPQGMIDSGVAPEPGKAAPNFLLMRADGSRLRLSDLLGRPVFLNFWADWCEPCKEEMPDMQRVADLYGDGLVVLGVNAGDRVEVGERFVAEAGVTYERLYDLNLDVTDGYQVRVMPTSYFIDEEGTIVDYSFGVMTIETMLEKVSAIADEPSI